MKVKISSGRAAFEASLLKAAHYFAHAAAAMDQENPSLTAHQRTHRQSLVIGCVLTSVAFLEAILNCVWDDLKNLNGSPESWFRDRRHLARIAKLGVSDNLKLSLLDRFDLTLAVTSSPALNPGARSYQDARLLVMLRNTLAHNRPEWEPPERELPSSRTLERRLRGKFRQDTQWKGSHPPFIPHRCLSSDCARWAVASAEQFSVEFFSHLGINTITIAAVSLTMQRLQKEGRGA